MTQIKVYFDGGYCGSGSMYGSWQIICPYFKHRANRSSFQSRIESNNVAEYMSLIEALDWLRVIPDKHLFSLEIRGDSMLVVCQVNGQWKVRKPHLQPLRNKVLDLLRDFGSWNIAWHRRNNSVALFGH